MEVSISTMIGILLALISLVIFVISVFVSQTKTARLKTLSKNWSSSITAVAIGIILFFLVILNKTDAANNFYASLSCEAERKFAPTSIVCTNESPDFDVANWTVNTNSIVQAPTNYSFNVDKAGEYIIQLDIEKKSLFSSRSAKAIEYVVVGEREEFERSISKTFRFSTTSSFTRPYELAAPQGFIIEEDSVEVKLSNHRGRSRIVQQEVLDNSVRVTISGVSKVKIKGFLSVRPETLEGTVLISFRAKKAELPP